VLQPEAALTVVIRTGDRTFTPIGAETSQSAVSAQAAASTQTSAPEPVAGSVHAAESVHTDVSTQSSVSAQSAVSTKPAAQGTSAPTKDLSGNADSTVAAESQDSAVMQSATYENTAPNITIGPLAEIERKKNTAAPAVTGSAADAVQPTVSHAVAYQDLQLKGEAVKAGDNTTPRPDPQHAPMAAPEPVATEKTSTQPLKSVSLEFAPDGARDVKVRLSERGGEVHVSVHSTDPSVTKNLRAGVTDLATVLANAGYDAKAWTSGRQQQDNPQQQDQQAPQRRASKADAGAESFDRILQQPHQENS
jgi:hypothetical protein